MKTKKFDFTEDYERIKEFLTQEYIHNQNLSCWPPTRFDDLIYRVDTLYKLERNRPASQDYIFIWEDNNEIVALILPDGAYCYTSIKRGYEYLFSEMIDIAEKELRPLFPKNENGKINFIVVASDKLTYKVKELESRGYQKSIDMDYDNFQYPQNTNYIINLKEGYKVTTGEELEDLKKCKACHYGFKHFLDDDNLEGSDFEGPLSYENRKKSSFYPDSFEMLITKDNDICSYSFCYVDKKTNTALIEPVSTRLKYRRQGIGTAMLQAIIIKLKELGIQKCYVNSYAEWRKNFYNKAGFITEDQLGFWSKEI